MHISYTNLKSILGWEQSYKLCKLLCLFAISFWCWLHQPATVVFVLPHYLCGKNIKYYRNLNLIETWYKEGDCIWSQLYLNLKSFTGYAESKLCYLAGITQIFITFAKIFIALGHFLIFHHVTKFYIYKILCIITWFYGIELLTK